MSDLIPGMLDLELTQAHHEPVDVSDLLRVRTRGPDIRFANHLAEAEVNATCLNGAIERVIENLTRLQRAGWATVEWVIGTSYGCEEVQVEITRPMTEAEETEVRVAESTRQAAYEARERAEWERLNARFGNKEKT